MPSEHSERDYLVNPNVGFACGFSLSVPQLMSAVVGANRELAGLPLSLWRSIDLKSTGAIVGAYLAEAVASAAGAIKNPIEKGHPDVLPAEAARASEAELRNYPEGLEIKGTCGNIGKGVLLKPGDSRCGHLTGVTWQAHHQEVERLLAIIWDFDRVATDTPSPVISAGFYSSDLKPEDWGTISGTTGRNTKVSGLRQSGKQKLADGAVFVLDRKAYVERYGRLFGTLACLYDPARTSQSVLPALEGESLGPILQASAGR